MYITVPTELPAQMFHVKHSWTVNGRVNPEGFSYFPALTKAPVVALITPIPFRSFSLAP